MDWAKAIEINLAALIRIVTALAAMAGIAERLPKPVYYAVLGILRPAESAVRRLIIIAARGLVVKLSVARPMPKGLKIAAKKDGGPIPFQLSDSHKRFNLGPPKKRGPKFVPRVWAIDTDPLIPIFLRPPPIRNPYSEPPPKPKPDGLAGAKRLHLRIAAMTAALENIPYQAIRMARWLLRHNSGPGLPKRYLYSSPMRPGQPPGLRRRPREAIEFVLKECHGLAFDALRVNSS